MIALLPSEIARLILNYLEEENLTKTYQIFLDECKYLEECKMYLKRGIVVPKTIHGKTLSDYLVIDTHQIEPPKKRPTVSIYTQTDSIERNDINQDLSNENNCSILNNKRKLSLNEDKQETTKIEIDQESITSSVENYSPKSTNIDQQTCNGSAKKRRILIGKNVEKVPELTFSTIERSVDAFFSDAANNFNQQKEDNIQAEQAKMEQKNEIVFLMESKQDKKVDKIGIKLLNSQNYNQSSQNFAQKTTQPLQQQTSQQPQIIFDLITGQTTSIQNNQLFAQPQQTPLVILPRNIETPVVSRIQAIPKDPVKNIQPIIIEPFQKVHLTNALNLTGQVIDTNYNTRSNRNKIANIKPKNDGKIDEPPIEIFPKKKKVYNRVTPTIRAIYAKEQQNKEETLQQTNENSAKQEENEAKDVHDEIQDIFDLPYSKTDQKLNKSDSSDINLDDICVRTSFKNQDCRSKKINKIKKVMNKSKESDDDLDVWFGEEKNTPQENTIANPVLIGNDNSLDTSSTRTLRSRTNSQRKNF